MPRAAAAGGLERLSHVAAFADRAHGHRDRRRRARQPRQGRRRPGDPEREPDARPRRGRRPDRRTACGRRRHVPARLPRRGRDGRDQGLAAGPTSRSWSPTRPPRPPASSPAASPPARPVRLCRERLARERRTRARDRRLERQRQRRDGRAGPRRRRADGRAGRRADRRRPHEVLVCSTGVIGVPLPMERVEAGIRAAAAALSPDGGADGGGRDLHDRRARRSSRSGRSRSPAARCGSAAMAKGAGDDPPRPRDDDRRRHDGCRRSPARPLQRAAGGAAAARLQPHHRRRQRVDVGQPCSCSPAGASGVAVGEPEARAFGDALTGVCQDLALAIVARRRGRPPDRALRGGRCAHRRRGRARRAARGRGPARALRALRRRPELGPHRGRARRLPASRSTSTGWPSTSAACR